MKEQMSTALIRDLFQLMRQFPHPKLKLSSVDGLTRSEYELLGVLVIHHDKDRTALSVTELSNILQITPAGVTHLVNPLEEAGHIERPPALNDRRMVLIGLTRKGRRVADSLMAEIHEKLVGLVNHLREQDSRTLVRLMSKSNGFFVSQFEA